MILRPYQSDLVGEIELKWIIGCKVVAARLDTGGGKTPIISRIVDDHNGFVAVIAHRDKLVEQVSLMLARAGVRHDIIASEKTKRLIAKKHVKKFGQCFYVPGARVRVASIDTFIGAKNLAKWATQVTLWIVDEGHHVLRANKWGKGVATFSHPECKGLLLTATPERPDGKGLGRWADGFADALVEGPPMRWLIDQGFLCDYDVACPPSDLRVEGDPAASGEYSNAQLRTAARNSHIVGDVPAHYLRLAPGLTGITFSTDVETATKTVAAYRAAGVSAELITGNTDTLVRDRIFDRLEHGEINQVVAVDVISEGVDIPAVQVGTLARPTGSLITWRQQLGRILRPIYAPGYDLETQAGRLAAIAASPKPRALFIDHIGGFVDVHRLGAPDRPRAWSLDRREARKKKDDDEIPMRICANPVIDCFHPYERIYRACPKCGYAPEPVGRSAPEQVDGDLTLLTPEALAALQGRVFNLGLTKGEHDAGELARNVPSIALNRNWRAYLNRCNAIRDMLASMDRFAGARHAAGWSDSEIQRAFYLTFGIDVISVQGVETKEAIALKERIDAIVNNC